MKIGYNSFFPKQYSQTGKVQVVLTWQIQIHCENIEFDCIQVLTHLFIPTVQFCADKTKVISLKKGGYVAKRQHKHLHKASIHGSINFHANAFASEVKESRIRASLKPHKFLGKTQQTRRKLISERS